ncbi:hypothetical protein [Sphingomonas sp. ACRSK]|uniref:hypothetical protein n=1 Tax=Sphingomonas sp. ACRSK TaxID=2918213 RepID=UPI001EF48959|nr:hypothetical protein [Sphingomonas sp. ACRSK]MCG7349997.1 hypothetical protein [Sphingomonas sp. ACRSK]
MDVESWDEEDNANDIIDLAEKAGITTVDGLQSALNIEFSQYVGTFSAVADSPPWTVSLNFLAYVVLIISCRTHVNASYLIERDWNPDYAHRIEKILEDLE